MLQTIAVKEVTEVVRGVDDVTNDNTFLCEEDHLTVREVNVQEDTARRVRLGPIRGRGRDRPPTNGGRSRSRGNHGHSSRGDGMNGRDPVVVMNDNSNQERGHTSH
jgi:hypothetical protein